MSDKNNKISAMTVNDMKLVLSYSYSKIINSGCKLSTFPSVMLWGPPGVGKSQGIKELAKELEANVSKKVVVTDVRLILFNPVDLRGIPTANEDKTLAIWLKPKIFQMDDSDDVINILFLDEISAAPQSVQAAAYQLTLDRTVGEHKLPDNCIVIAAGNRVTDQSVAYQMPKALANRLMHIEIKPNATAWLKWAESAGVDENVRQFLTENSNYLLDKEVEKDDLAFASPRSWEMVSNILNSVDSNPEYMRALIVGMVGSVAADQFINWYKQKRKTERKKKRLSDSADRSLTTELKSAKANENMSDDSGSKDATDIFVSSQEPNKDDVSYYNASNQCEVWDRICSEMISKRPYLLKISPREVHVAHLERFLKYAADYIHRDDPDDFVVLDSEYYEIYEEANADNMFRPGDEIFNDSVINSKVVSWLEHREYSCQKVFINQLAEKIQTYELVDEFGNQYEGSRLIYFAEELLADAIDKGYFKKNDWNLTEAECRKKALDYFQQYKRECDRKESCNITGTDKDWEIEVDDEDIEIDLDLLPKGGLTSSVLDIRPKTPNTSSVIDIRPRTPNTSFVIDIRPDVYRTSKVRNHIYNLSKSELDWLDLLKDHVKKINPDYTFNPPDRRMDSCDVYLPSFTEDEENPKNILFMIDTSASMRDHQIAALKKQVKKACIQYKDNMKGWLGFFDAEVTPPKAFSDSKTVQTIKPVGGGGTNFDCIFEYVNNEWVEEKPECIVVMTDGECTYPNEAITNGIPVIWVIMNNTSCIPPFGKTVYATCN